MANDPLLPLRQDARLLIEAGRRGSDVSVPTCPGWTVADALLHVGRYGRWIGDIVRTRSQEAMWPGPNEYGYYREDPALANWAKEGLHGLIDSLDGVDPGERVWSWCPADQTVGFWLKLVEQETAIHRFDVQSAFGPGDPVDPSTARQSIDFTFDAFLAVERRQSIRPAHGESYRFEQTDGDGRWVVRFPGDEVEVDRGEGEADVTFHGTASDLLLLLWKRVPPDRVDVRGDASLVGRFFELAPPA